MDLTGGSIQKIYGINGNEYVTIRSMSYSVRELLLPDGRSPFAEWFVTLDPMTAAKGRVVPGMRALHGARGPGYRIYLAGDGRRVIILLGGGSKKKQQKDIDEAVALWDDYRRRKAQTRKGEQPNGTDP